MLGPENPIQHYGEVYFFETDLEDTGYAMSKARFRVMADCFYVLLRYFLRVDGVCVRILDTRIFHAFGEPFLRREFQYRESTFQQLMKAGFNLSSEWTLSPNADDQVFQSLETKYISNEKILL